MSNEGYEYLFILDIQQILLIPIVDIQEIIASSMSNEVQDCNKLIT